MKIRQGFVSNSSSSSFIVGIGLINDSVKFEKWRSKYKSYGIEVIKNEEIDDQRKWSNLKVRQGYFAVDAPTNDGYEDVTIDMVNRKNEDIVVVCIGNNEGDDAFWEEDKYGGDLNWDIDLDWFSDEQQDLYHTFGSDESGIGVCEITYGAARNG